LISKKSGEIEDSEREREMIIGQVAWEWQQIVT
jgi:hypothetical protein